MSSAPVGEQVPASASPPPPPRQSGLRTVLRYTGIPPSWLDKRPKLPSRNWLIFLSATSSLVGLYVYDRKRCKTIRQEYVDKVKHLSEIPVDPFDTPRRVTVYGAKWPGDEDYDQSLRYFRKYVKPILVAAAVDYTLVPGKRHGDIARHVAEATRVRRREDMGIDQDPDVNKALPTYKPLQARREHEKAGGIVLVGRPTVKEFMAGLKKGWSDGLDKVDRDEELARILENDNHFDEPDEPDAFGVEPDTESTKFPSAKDSPVFSPLKSLSSTPPRPSQNSPSATTTSAPPPQPTSIPLMPPILFVPFLDYIGIKQIPIMLWDFFNQRQKVQSGAEAGYRLVMGVSRPLDVPVEVPESADAPSPIAELSTSEPAPPAPIPSQGDLDFDRDVEWWYNRSTDSLHSEIEKYRTKYYEELPKRLVTARELARGKREWTKEETENPPPTEVELRAERLKKERRWRDDVDGWDIVRPQSSVAWAEHFRGSLYVFTDPSPVSDPPEDETKS